MEKAEMAPGDDTDNARSASLAWQPSITGYCTDREEENKFLTEGIVELIENDNEVQKKSKKCSVFATISEHESKSNERGFNKYEFVGAGVTKGRKYSKKVSIAE